MVFFTRPPETFVLPLGRALGAQWTNRFASGVYVT
jgi:hypothetical protein